jgi:hypothetical protein
MTDGKKHKQIADQCKVVVHLAGALAEVFGDYARRFGEYPPDDFTCGIAADGIGRLSAAVMDKLGDILNGMDAASDEDEWVDPIFEKAQQLWPSTK